jgi:hypothetical protein
MTSLAEIYSAILSAVQAVNSETKTTAVPTVPAGYLTVSTSSGATVKVPFYTTVPN